MFASVELDDLTLFAARLLQAAFQVGNKIFVAGLSYVDRFARTHFLS
jgi:hypothetical protein